MGFRRFLARALDRRLSAGLRFRNLCACAERHAFTARCSFDDVRTALQRAGGLTLGQPFADAGLDAAAAHHIGDAHAAFRERLAAFATLRRAQKRAGRRQPHWVDLDALYCGVHPSGPHA